MPAIPPTPPFPTTGIMPREETQSGQFVRANPTYDGRFVTIGILDTGVDFSCAGLQTTTEGVRKLVDVIDCTGSGDVAITSTATLSAANTLTALSGKTLTLPPPATLNLHPSLIDTTTTPPTYTFSLGVKRAYELFPTKLATRVAANNKEARKESHNKNLQTAHKALADYKPANGAKLTVVETKTKQDLSDKIEALTKAYDGYEDPGMVMDVVVYKDVDGNYAALIPSADDATGDYTTLLPMFEYRLKHQHKLLCAASMLNFAVSFTEDGKICTITTDAGAHGSHVAGIAAGYFPDDESLNGVAGGAKIVSLKIGDSRLGSMETGVGICRAMTEAVKRGCDVINMSYGEAAAAMNTGRFTELANELVNKHNIVFVSSAGNNGPALTTVGAPGGSASSIISVGAYVSPSMMVADYSMRETPPDGTNYTWSSIGPAADGDRGVDIIAPGGAITNVPTWCLQKSQLMNGTSMSSPNCAGCIALLISALKQRGVAYTSSRIKQAIFNTAKLMPKLSTLTQGSGMIQVTAAYEHLIKFSADKTLDVYYEATMDRVATPRGVYMRQPEETRKKQTFNITVSPKFFPDGVDGAADLETQQARVNFEMKMNLRLGPEQHSLPRQSPAPYVSHPDHLMLMHNGRTFSIEVDPTALESGLYTTQLTGYDATDPDKGALFSFPITIVKPTALPPNEPSPNLGQMNFGPAETYRFFLTPPAGATFMDITVKDCRKAAGDDASSRLMVLHTMQLFPHTPYRDREMQTYLRTTPGSEKVSTVKVEGGVTVEVCLARFWSALGFTELSCDVQFRGITPSPTKIIMNPGCPAHVRVQSHVKDEVCAFSSKLKTWERFIRPKDSVVAPVEGGRDVLSGNRQVYSITLTYEFKLDEDATVKMKAPLLNGFLYESAFEAQMALWFNGDKKFLGVSDCWPEGVKCSKGTTTVRFQIRHDEVHLLKQFENMVVSIEQNLKAPIALVAFKSHEAMVTGGGKFGRRILHKGNMASMHLAPPDDSKLPKGFEAGDVLSGTVDFEGGDSAAPGGGVRPDGWEIQYVVPVAAPKKKEDKAAPSEVKDERNELEKMDEQQRDWLVEKLGKLVGGEDDKFNLVFEHLKEKYPAHLPLLVLQLKHLDNDKDSTKWMGNLKALIEKCDEVIKLIDQEKLAIFMGTKHDLMDGAVVAKKKEMDEQKKVLCDAMGRKCRALIDDAESKEEEFVNALGDLKKWAKIEGEGKYAVLELEMCKNERRFGTMLVLINKLGDGEGTKGGLKEYSKSDLLGLRSEVYGWCGWEELVLYDREWKILNNMKEYQLF